MSKKNNGNNVQDLLEQQEGPFRPFSHWQVNELSP
jgi:hypothetical protein